MINDPGKHEVKKPPKPLGKHAGVLPEWLCGDSWQSGRLCHGCRNRKL